MEVEKIQLVEDALLNTALGYYMIDEDETWAPKVDKDGNRILDSNGEPLLELVGKKRKKKYYQKSVMAQKEWLKVNHPEKYAQLNKDQLKSGLSDIISAIGGSVEELFKEDDEE